tara:strand:- start:158 stop:472 length:315 start_codon:yes stop_codon:yes gene_type:complete
MPKAKKNAKGVSHNLKDTMGARVIHTIDTAGTHVVVGGKVENIQVCPEGNELLPKTQRKYLYPKTMNWVSYMRARRLKLEQGVDLFNLPENEIKKVEKAEPESK